jgi:methyl-accepting chemotaxis protein
MNMSRLSIRVILLGALALIGAAFLVQSALNLSSILKTASEAEEIGTNGVPSIEKLGKIKFLATRYRLNGARLLLARDEEQVRSLQAFNDDLARQSETIARDYAAFLDDEPEKEAFAEYERAWSTYRELQNQSLALARNGNKDQAADLFSKEAFEAFNAALGKLDKGIAINKEQVQALLAEVAAASRSSLGVVLCGGAIMLLLIGVSVYVVIRRVTLPLTTITAAMRSLAAGHLSTAVPHAERSDEVGEMAQAVQVFRENALRVQALEEEEKRATQDRMRRAQTMAEVVADVGRVVRLAAEGDFSARLTTQAEDPELDKLVGGINELNRLVDEATGEFSQVLGNLAQGDLTRMIATDYRGRLGDLKNALNETVRRLAETVATIQTAAHDVETAAQEIRAGANDLSSRTEQQASALEETAATTEELAASVKSSATASRQADQLARQAMGVAAEGGEIAVRAVGAMTRIEQASQKISAITGVIDEIAFQTNLLALNAAVEAARAGEAGKGFAVVASEVRSLAQRASEAAREISTLIGTSVQEVVEGADLVRSAGGALSRIVQATESVTDMVSEISAAAGEQSNGIEEMSQAIAHMDEMTQQNAALAEESAASATSLTDQISRLSALVGQFKTSTAAMPRAAAPLLRRVS